MNTFKFIYILIPMQSLNFIVLIYAWMVFPTLHMSLHYDCYDTYLQHENQIHYIPQPQYGGQRCVAMSLCALIYSKITKITSVDDMTQIMIVGIQLYSSLSLLARQSMLKLTEMVTVFEQFFHLEYSDSYTCNIQSDPRGIEGYHYCNYATHRVQHLKHSWH